MKATKGEIVEEELSPIAGGLLVAGVTIVGALVISRLLDRWVDKRLRQMDRARLLNMEVPKP
jgi:hypothetical protein